MGPYKVGDIVALRSGFRGEIVNVIEDSSLAAEAFYNIKTTSGFLRLDGLHIVGSIGQSLLPKLTRLSERVVHWFQKAEEGYGNRIFYTSDIDKMDNERKRGLSALPGAVGSDAVDRIRLVDVPADKLRLLAHNGTADGFIGRGKNFSLNLGARPSESVRSFICGKLTICECEGMVFVVFLNAICDLIGDRLFDMAFKGLQVVQGRNDFSACFNQVSTGVSEDTIQIGDWVYYTHDSFSADKFRELAKKNSKGGAATGWNLVCATKSPNSYFGFGLTNSSGHTHALPKVRSIMIEECGGMPTAQGWNLVLAFRRRLTPARLVTWLNTRFI